ncbi:MAG TPA: DUF5615 family PIN-like protein [Planctomycetota bacterium]|nr:DUF5615 family PIN-like protein [Planctomycetota bacterium]
MRFMVDASTGTRVAEFLRSLGHDVLSADDAMPAAADDVILARAEAERRIVVTNDKDFGELAFRSRKARQGIILLRLRDEGTPNRIRVVGALLARAGDKLSGRFTTADDWHYRIRPMPAD